MLGQVQQFLFEFFGKCCDFANFQEMFEWSYMLINPFKIDLNKSLIIFNKSNIIIFVFSISGCVDNI